MNIQLPNNFKVIIISLAGLLIFLSFQLSAQTEEKEDQNSLKQGAWALQFQIDSNFSLKSFQGAIISAKYHLTDSKAIRIGISGNYSKNDNNNNNINYSADTLGFQQGDIQNSKDFGFSIIMQYLSYVNTQNEVLLFWGTGPVIQYSKSSMEGTTNSNYVVQSSQQIQSNDNHSWGIGASGVLGVEWFAAKSFSLHAEYGINLLYIWSESESSSQISYQPSNQRYNYVSSGNNKGWVFNASSVKLGLSVYF